VNSQELDPVTRKAARAAEWAGYRYQRIRLALGSTREERKDFRAFLKAERPARRARRPR